MIGINLSLKKKEADGFVYINKIENKGKDSYVVFEPEQIHVLSSKADIQGFKEFVDNNQSNAQYQLPQSEQSYDAAGFKTDKKGLIELTHYSRNNQNPLDKFPRRFSFIYK